MYPRYFPGLLDAHHFVAHALAGRGKSSRLAPIVYFLSRWWAVVARIRGAAVFLSIEALYRHGVGSGAHSLRRLRYLKRVKRAFAPFDIEAVVVFRRPDDYLRARYQERVAGSTDTVGPFSDFIRSFPPRLDYARNAKLLKQALPRLRCVLYEDLQSSTDFCESFFRIIGINAGGSRGVGRIRPSMTAPETLAKAYANRFISSKHANRRFVRLMQTTEFKTILSQHYGAQDYSLWPSHSARLRLVESRATDLEKLRNLCFPDRETLFLAPSPSDTKPHVPPLPTTLQRFIRLLAMKNRNMRWCIRQLRARVPHVL